MRRRKASGQSRGRGSDGQSAAWKILIVALVAAIPPWFVGVVVTDWLFRIGTTGSGSRWISASFSLPLVLAPVFALILDAAAAAVLHAHGSFRADRWWLAGGLFVIDALLAMIATDVPSSGDFVFLHIMLSVLSGYWILSFAAGALVWRRLTPTYIPVDWVRPRDPEEE